MATPFVPMSDAVRICLIGGFPLKLRQAWTMVYGHHAVILSASFQVLSVDKNKVSHETRPPRPPPKVEVRLQLLPVGHPPERASKGQFQHSLKLLNSGEKTEKEEAPPNTWPSRVELADGHGVDHVLPCQLFSTGETNDAVCPGSSRAPGMA